MAEKEKSPNPGSWPCKVWVRYVSGKWNFLRVLKYYYGISRSDILVFFTVTLPVVDWMFVFIQKPYVETLPPCDCIRRWAFGRQLGLGDVIREALLNETGVFMSIMTSLLPVSALHHMRVQEVSRLHLSKRALIRTQPGWCPHFRISGSRTTTHKFQLFIIHPAYNFSSIAPGTAWDAFWLVFHLSF